MSQVVQQFATENLTERDPATSQHSLRQSTDPSSSFASAEQLQFPKVTLQGLKSSEIFSITGENREAPQSPGLSKLQSVQIALPNSAEIAILGGGLAGCSALRHLAHHGAAQAGLGVHLFEAQEYVGGRVKSVYDSRGVQLNAGAELINVEHSRMRSLAEDLRVELVALYRNPRIAPKISYHQDGRHYSPEALATALTPLAQKIRLVQERINSGDDTYAAYLDSISVKEYLATAGLSPWARHAVEVYAVSEVESRSRSNQRLFLPCTSGLSPIALTHSRIRVMENMW